MGNGIAADAGGNLFSGGGALMTTTYYGVDSVDDARTVLPNLKAKWGVYPSLYARYVVGGYVTSKEEVDALLALGVRVVHVCNFGDAGTVGGSSDQGAADARTAILAMQATGVPAGKGLLFRDIETAWVPSVAYLTGWSSALAAANQPGGFYANAEWTTFDAPYAAIVAGVGRLHRLVWTSEPENVGYVPPPGPAWNPFAPPSDPSAVVGWQFCEQPSQIPDVDLNLWTAEAYGLAYGAPKPPTPNPTYRISKTAALKQGPSHSSSDAIDPQHRPVILERGTEVLKLGIVCHTDDSWQSVGLPASPVHGYVLAANIENDPV
jgi:Domain of unknown function (DUF1906)